MDFQLRDNVDERRNIKLNKNNIRSSMQSRKRKRNPMKFVILRIVSFLISMLFLAGCIWLGRYVQAHGELFYHVKETEQEVQPGEGKLWDIVRDEDSTAPELEQLKKLHLIGGKGEKIGISLPNQYRERWTRFSNHFKETMRAAGYTPVVTFALKRPDKQIFKEPNVQKEKIASQQNADLLELYKSGCKVIFVIPEEVNALKETLTEIKDRGVTVIAINQLPMKTTGLNYLIGYDDLSVGQTEGAYLVKALGLQKTSEENESDASAKPKTLEIFAGDTLDSSLWFRVPGFMEELFPYLDDGSLVIPSKQKELEQFTIDALSDRQEKENAKVRMKAILEKYFSSGQTLDAVLCTSDLLAAGVAEALQDAMEDGIYTGTWPVITGDGGEEASIGAIRDHRQTMTIFRNPEKLAGVLTEAADAIVHGQEPEINDRETYQNGSEIVPAYRMKPTVLTNENLEREYIAPGFALSAEIID